MPFDEILFYVLTPIIVGLAIIFIIPNNFNCLIPIALVFKLGLALSNVMDAQHYSVNGYDEEYCQMSGIMKTFWFDAAVLCIVCYIV